MTSELRCDAVHKSYGGVRVLQGVSLLVSGGEILGLVGANGAGKSTLIDIISGQQLLDSGGIYLGDRLATGFGAVARAREGLARTFQRPQLASELTVRQNVAVGEAVRTLNGLCRSLAAIARGIIQADELSPAVEDACDKVALRDIDRIAGEVTFGELRQIEVARVLMQRPHVVLLDEPFSGVGDSGIRGILEALDALRHSGCAVLLVDHNIDLLAPVVDRLALLSQGEIVIDADVPTCLNSAVFRETYIGAK